MRALAVVAVDEVVEAGLLLQEVGGGGLGGFFLQRQVDALMADARVQPAENVR
jgi:hypothetical protein